MSPWLIAVPVVGGVVFWLATRKAEAAPSAAYAPLPPSRPALMSGGSRALSYLQRLNAALLAYRAVKVIGGTALANALAELRGTLDVVSGMAENDRLAGGITDQDLAQIKAKVAEIRKEIGG